MKVIGESCVLWVYDFTYAYTQSGIKMEGLTELTFQQILFPHMVVREASQSQSFGLRTESKVSLYRFPSSTPDSHTSPSYFFLLLTRWLGLQPGGRVKADALILMATHLFFIHIFSHAVGDFYRSNQAISLKKKKVVWLVQQFLLQQTHELPSCRYKTTGFVRTHRQHPNHPPNSITG